MNNRNKQQGFTLIELLVVVSILASLAGLTSVAMDGYQKDSEETITRVEMQRISNAIRRFKADTGYWPKTGPFGYDTNAIPTVSSTAPVASYPMTQYRDEYFNNDANFWWLFEQPPTRIGYWDTTTASLVDSKLDEHKLWQWDHDAAMGWHGPYINHDSIKTITIDGAGAGCSSYTQTQLQTIIDKPHSTYPDHIIRRFNGLVDRFQQIREKNTGKDYCVLTRDKKNMNQFKVAEYSASPYLYEAKFTHTNSSLCTKNADTDLSVTCAALRSLGPDGEDNGGADTSDDIVFVLQVNSKLGE
jgi:prepilin-type N-terminal cleavage/methylation domain-containing protein